MGSGPSGLRAWSRRHAYSLLSSLGAMLRAPLATAMTVAVLAIALSLPLGLYTTLENLRDLSRGWERLDSISVFLELEQDDQQADRLASRLSNWPEVLAVDPISPQQGLDELAGAAGLSRLELEDNPLPWVLEVSPVAGSEVAELADRIEAEDGVDAVLVDLQWLERLDAMVAVLARLVEVLAVLFGLAVLFVIANTIRAEIQTRHEEIEVLTVVGATPGFVRRPFLYSGLWMGLAGGLVAWLLVTAALVLLSGPAGQLAAAYATTLQLSAPPPALVAALIAGAGMLGIAGAWIAVGRHLRRLNP